jgi:hydroxymethylglutaryl-CoA lyase
LTVAEAGPGAGTGRRVEIVEVGPRDGLQNQPQLVSTADKATLVRRAVAAGSRRVEVTSFVNPRKVPQLADAEALMTEVGGEAGLTSIGLVVNERGLDRALAAKVDEVNFIVLASDTFNKRNQGVPTGVTLAEILRLAPRAHGAGLKVSVTVGASFGCPFEGEVPLERVLRLVEALGPAEPDEVALADTIGVAVPGDVYRAFSEVPTGAQLRCHFHNTRSLGVANVLAAAGAGVTAFDASAGGIGGCPFAPKATGNVATEDVVYALERSGYRTGVSLDAAIGNALWLGTVLGGELPGMLSRAGGFPVSFLEVAA